MTGTRFGARGSMVSVHLADWERRLLAEMVGELRRNLLDHTPARDGGDGLDPSLRRLFPPAYLSDPDRDTDYQRLMRDELLAERLDHLDLLDGTLKADHLDDSQVTAWIQGLNELRLVLGTQLNISEQDDSTDVDPHDPGQRPRLRYHYLGGLLAELIDAAHR
ncbi:DUF2017 family protein [Candidatus Poriferisodalis sp.]|uniref:DUF2017 family protein n=1 Tax=Candidatus Poriferisodalis sp. TaxID=3101277 RepID=UPI003C6EC8D3